MSADDIERLAMMCWPGAVEWNTLRNAFTHAGMTFWADRNLDPGIGYEVIDPGMLDLNKPPEFPPMEIPSIW